MSRFLGTENSVDSIEKASTVIIPVPLEYSTSYGKGTAFGPQAILKASAYLEFYDEELNLETWKTGIFTTPEIDVSDKPDKCLHKIEDVVSSYLSNEKFIVVIGGEHSLTFAVHAAFQKMYPEISVLLFDAHSDLRDTYEGSKYSHACVMRRIWEKNNNLVEVGVRSQSVEEKEYILENNIPVFYAHDLHGREFPSTILDKLTQDVFITFDTDFFDPAIMPGVGTPEPGGFFWYETLSFLKKVFDYKNVVGMDVVEFSPVDNLTHPQFLLAKFIYKMIGYKINR
jgi:agmatinase